MALKDEIDRQKAKDIRYDQRAERRKHRQRERYQRKLTNLKYACRKTLNLIDEFKQVVDERPHLWEGSRGGEVSLGHANYIGPNNLILHRDGSLSLSNYSHSTHKDLCQDDLEFWKVLCYYMPRETIIRSISDWCKHHLVTLG